jgi:hypothetical protein
VHCLCPVLQYLFFELADLQLRGVLKRLTLHDCANTGWRLAVVRQLGEHIHKHEQVRQKCVCRIRLLVAYNPHGLVQGVARWCGVWRNQLLAQHTAFMAAHFGWCRATNTHQC